MFQVQVSRSSGTTFAGVNNTRLPFSSHHSFNHHYPSMLPNPLRRRLIVRKSHSSGPFRSSGIPPKSPQLVTSHTRADLPVPSRSSRHHTPSMREIRCPLVIGSLASNRLHQHRCRCARRRRSRSHLFRAYLAMPLLRLRRTVVSNRTIICTGIFLIVNSRNSVGRRSTLRSPLARGKSMIKSNKYNQYKVCQLQYATLLLFYISSPSLSSLLVLTTCYFSPLSLFSFYFFKYLSLLFLFSLPHLFKTVPSVIPFAYRAPPLHTHALFVRMYESKASKLPHILASLPTCFFRTF